MCGVVDSKQADQLLALEQEEEEKAAGTRFAITTTLLGVQFSCK